MAKFCPNCGNEVNENAVICVKCGTSLTPGAEEAVSAPATETATPKAKGGVSISLVLGILGIVFAWLFALLGHILSIAGIITGVMEYKKTKNKVGLIVSIVGEVFAICSSLLGILLSLLMYL